MNNIFDISEQSLQRASLILKNGGLVAFPTETVYGLGANALNPDAVAQIFRVKKRPFFDPLIVHIHSVLVLDSIADEISDLSYSLMERFWPGPLTLIFKKKNIIPDIVTSGHPTVAVRIPSDPTALRLLELAGVPVSAPSANPFKYLSPTTALHVYEQIGSEVDMIIDGGHSRVGVESTVLDMTADRPVLLRYGGLDIDEICDFLGYRIKVATESEKPIAPGQLLHHYSPTTRLILVDDIDSCEMADGVRCGYIGITMPERPSMFKHIEILTRDNNMNEAAVNLFSALHRLDELSLDIIYAERIPETGLGTAIMDRLKKASYIEI